MACARTLKVMAAVRPGYPRCSKPGAVTTMSERPLDPSTPPPLHPTSTSHPRRLCHHHFIFNLPDILDDTPLALFLSLRTRPIICESQAYLSRILLFLSRSIPQLTSSEAFAIRNPYSTNPEWQQISVSQSCTNPSISLSTSSVDFTSSAFEAFTAFLVTTIWSRWIMSRRVA